MCLGWEITSLFCMSFNHFDNKAEDAWQFDYWLSFTRQSWNADLLRRSMVYFVFQQSTRNLFVSFSGTIFLNLPIDREHSQIFLYKWILSRVNERVSFATCELSLVLHTHNRFLVLIEWYFTDAYIQMVLTRKR